jgi:hypothetical protein
VIVVIFVKFVMVGEVRFVSHLSGFVCVLSLLNHSTFIP